jgi:hypothetical protein
MIRFRPVRRRNGGFGHCIGKYGKHPAIQHNRNLEGYRDIRARAPIANPAETVQEAILKYRPPGRRK